jgi:hypothetical protein
MLLVRIHEMGDYIEKRIVLPKGSAIEGEMDHPQS